MSIYTFIQENHIKNLYEIEKAKESFNNSLKINKNFYEAKKELENLN